LVTAAGHQSIQRLPWFEVDRDVPGTRCVHQFLELTMQTDDLKTDERTTRAKRLLHRVEAKNDIGTVSASSGSCHRADPRS
jgi:hypothetical protein